MIAPFVLVLTVGDRFRSLSTALLPCAVVSFLLMALRIQVSRGRYWAYVTDILISLVLLAAFSVKVFCGENWLQGLRGALVSGCFLLRPFSLPLLILGGFATVRKVFREDGR